MTREAIKPRLDITVDAAVAAYKKTGSVNAAADLLGCHYTVVRRRLKQNTAGDVMPAPEGHEIKGVSTLFGADGSVKAQWVKTRVDEETILRRALEAIRLAFEETPKVRKIAAPRSTNSKLLTVYPIGDHHFGMRSWKPETGADYDIEIASDLLTAAAAHLVDLSPDSETGMIINVGDWFHVDNLKNETSRSGHILDVDTRYAHMIRMGTLLMRAVIERGLVKHKRMRVVCAIGNHDDIGAIWLQQALAMMYEDNPRVSIETKPGKFHYHQHGKVLIGVTHGDTGKPEKLQGVMAADVPEMWGATKFRYWLTGHVHHRKQLEFPGVMWETFRTLAPADAWAAGAGYRSGRDMTSLVLHAEHGEVARHRFDVSMLEAA